MCGICGIYTFAGEAPAADVRRMRDRLAHRGPDGAGEFVSGPVALGHRRLSIIDIAGGAQPMGNEDGALQVVYNGEIYNYRELMAELQAKGHHFHSRSDAEVIVHAYEEWGAACVQHFNGMWAFALWDSRRRELFLSRDRFGIKPLYYHVDDGELIFASEIKALLAVRPALKQPHRETVVRFLGGGALDDTESTFYAGIVHLAPGHSLTVRPDGTGLARYWQLPDGTLGLSVEDAATRFAELLADAVQLRLRSDVPVGSCLSGGLDSSAIVCLMRRSLGAGGDLHTFSSCYEDPVYDERRYIDVVTGATQAASHRTFPQVGSLVNDLRALRQAQDEPFEGTSMYAQWCVMRLAQEQGLKVLLDGQGADELLAGYHGYVYAYFGGLLRRAPQRVPGELLAYLRRHGGSARYPYAPMHRLHAIIRRHFLPRLRQEEWLVTDGKPAPAKYAAGEAGAGLNARLRVALVRHLRKLLRYEDRNSMAHSIETRLPFLDYRLVEFVTQLPEEHKFRAGETKHLLRRGLRGTVPDAILDRQDKMGFVTPETAWLDRSRMEIEALLHDSRDRGEFTLPAGRQRLWQLFNREPEVYHQSMWNLINFLLWYEEL